MAVAGNANGPQSPIVHLANEATDKTHGAVIASEFGDPEADAAAKRKLQEAFPGRDVVQINIDAIAAGGGGIHCTTQQEPKV